MGSLSLSLPLPTPSETFQSRLFCAAVYRHSCVLEGGGSEAGIGRSCWHRRLEERWSWCEPRRRGTGGRCRSRGGPREQQRLSTRADADTPSAKSCESSFVASAHMSFRCKSFCLQSTVLYQVKASSQYVNTCSPPSLALTASLVSSQSPSGPQAATPTVSFFPPFQHISSSR